MENATFEAIKRDITFAQELFGKKNVFWPKNLSWLRIENYGLPRYYSKTHTDLLIVIPPRYGLVNIPLKEFYMTKGLKIKTRSGWKTIPHYHTKKYNKLCKQGWAWFCIYSISWNQKDSILTFLKLIDLLMQNPFTERT